MLLRWWAGPNSKHNSAVMTVTAGMAAILFFDFNKQNREWNYTSTLEYLRQIEAGQWEFTNQGIGFLQSGNVGDGQHRLAGIALSGKAVEIPVIFGMSENAIIAIDTGRRRQPADYLHIVDHTEMATAKRHQQMVKRAFNFLAKDDNEERRAPFVLKSSRDVVVAVQHNEKMLNEAISIGDELVKGLAKPTFPAPEAAALAFMLLIKGWPTDRLIADINQFQSGEDREGGNSPLFVAADQLAKDAAKRERSSATQRYSATVQAFLLHEKGVKAVRAADIRAAMKPKQWIDPSFPGAEVIELKTA